MQVEGEGLGALTYASFSTTVEGWEEEEEEWGEEEGEAWEWEEEEEEEEEGSDDDDTYVYDRTAAEVEFYGEELLRARQREAAAAVAQACAANDSSIGGGGAEGEGQEEEGEEEEGKRDPMALLLEGTALGRLVAWVGGEGGREGVCMRACVCWELGVGGWCGWMDRYT